MHAQALRIIGRDLERGRANIGTFYDGAGNLGRDRAGNRAASDARLEYGNDLLERAVRGDFRLKMRDTVLDQVLGLGAGDQHVFVYGKLALVKTREARDIRHRHTARAFLAQRGVLLELRGREKALAVGMQPFALTPERVGEQNLRVRAGVGLPFASSTVPRASDSVTVWGLGGRGFSGQQTGAFILEQLLDDMPHITVHDPAYVAEVLVDAMVGDAVLGKVVGTYLLRAVACPHLTAAHASHRLFGLPPLAVVEHRAQHIHRLRAVLYLRALLLRGHDDARGNVRDPDRGLRLVHVLAAGTARFIRVDLQVARIDVDVDVFVHLRQHGDGGGACVDASLRFGNRHALHAMHARLVLEMFIRRR